MTFSKFLLFSLLPFSLFAEDPSPYKEELPIQAVSEEPCAPVYEEEVCVPICSEEPCEPVDEENEVCMSSEETQTLCVPEPRWYFQVNPGYLWFTESSMREFYGNGGFTIRGEFGCQVYGPLIVWVDGGYFQKEGRAIGGPEKTNIVLATLTLGLKLVHSFNDFFAVYGGAGPRLFMMKLHNESPFVRGEDNQIGIGGGFDAGFSFFPFARYKGYIRNFYINALADYSMKKLKIEEDEISSVDFDVNVSSLTVGGGLGIKF